MQGFWAFDNAEGNTGCRMILDLVMVCIGREVKLKTVAVGSVVNLKNCIGTGS